VDPLVSRRTPSERRQNAEQRQRTQHEADDRLKDCEQEEGGHTNALPEKPQDAPAQIAGGQWPVVPRSVEIRDAHRELRSVGAAQRALRTRVGRKPVAGATAFAAILARRSGFDRGGPRAADAPELSHPLRSCKNR
jgi:hypothetical protein